MPQGVREQFAGGAQTQNSPFLYFIFVRRDSNGGFGGTQSVTILLRGYTKVYDYNLGVCKYQKVENPCAIIFFVGICSWLADKLYFILSYEAVFYKPNCPQSPTSH